MLQPTLFSCQMPTVFFSTYTLLITVTAKSATWTLFLTRHGLLPSALESALKFASLSISERKPGLTLPRRPAAVLGGGKDA